MRRAIPVLLSNVALWTAAILMWDGLPERIPLHFGASGQPDRWGPPSAANWLLLPILCSVASLAMLGTSALIGWMAVRCPELVNVPDKPLWSALPAAARERCLMPMRNLLAWLGVAMAALFGWVMAGTADVADGRASVLPWWPVALFVGLALGLVAWSLVRVRQRIAIEVALQRQGR